MFYLHFFIDIIIITHGKIVSEALKAKEQLLSEKGIRVGIILLEFLKPYDKIAKVRLQGGCYGSSI